VTRRRLSTVALAAAAALVVAGNVAYLRLHAPRAASRTSADSAPARFTATFDVSHFLKGNLHTHSDRSDGDSAPADVVAWYRAHGYDFLALTDHDLRSDPDDPSLAPAGLRLIAGEEVTMTGAGRQVHMNALCTQSTIGGRAFDSAAAALTWGAGAIAEQHGVALVNHPNFDRGISPADLLSASSASLLEIASGHPYVFSQGVDDRPSHEALWDWSLGHGMHLMGVGVDDMHHLQESEKVEPPAFPGRAWVQVFAVNDDEASICEALRGGHLYASTGAELARVRVTTDAYTVWPRQKSAVVFVGSEGRELQRTSIDAGAEATYRPHASDVYVRARLETDAGRAWTPAVFVAP
jgi:hypothetical protein